MRVFNFAAGPAALPTEVLEQVRAELTDWQGLGASVMELSHRGKPFMAAAQEAEATLRELLAIPAAYKATIGFLAILLILTLRPRGLLGARA